MKKAVSNSKVKLRVERLEFLQLVGGQLPLHGCLVPFLIGLDHHLFEQGLVRRDRLNHGHFMPGDFLAPNELKARQILWQPLLELIFLVDHNLLRDLEWLSLELVFHGLSCYGHALKRLLI